MTVATLDRRVHAVIELPRHRVAEDWMDVGALAFETRRDVAAAWKTRRLEPLYAADAKLVRLSEFARRRAGEAEGIDYITPGQELLPFADGCLPEDDGAA